MYYFGRGSLNTPKINLGTYIFSTYVSSKCDEVVKFSTLKFIYSEKATKFCEISTLLLTTVHTVKSKVEISQNFVAFSEYVNFNPEWTDISRQGEGLIIYILPSFLV